jgi:MFS family permease
MQRRANKAAEKPSHSRSSTLAFKPSENDPDVATNSQDIGIGTYLTIVSPLLLVYISNQWSRSSLYYLVNFSDSTDVTAYTAMNVDLGFSQAQYGALASVAFTALFAVTSLFAGNFADKNDRRVLTAGSAAVWSAATLGTSIAATYEQVVICRIIMGLACAFTTPAAYTLIRDSVPPSRAAFANSLYGGGIYLGGALASLSILLDNSLGWRGALGSIGVYGFTCASLSVLILPADPKTLASEGLSTMSGESNETESMSVIDDAKAVLSSPRVRWLFLASFTRFCSGLCIGVWGAPYFRSAFPDNATSYAVVNAFIVGLCGITSGILGGVLSDKAAEVASDKGIEENTGRLAVPIVGSLLAVPSWWLAVNSSTFELSMVWLAVEYLVAECWFGSAVAVLQSSVGKERGGTAQGMFTLTGAVGNLAPSLLGVLYGQATSQGVENQEALSNLLGVAVCGGYLISAVCFFLSSQAPIADDTN